MPDEKTPDAMPDDETPDTTELENLGESEGFYIPKDEPGANPDPKEAASVDTADMCAALLTITFNIVASRKGAHWKMAPEEAAEAGKAYGAVIDKYFPGDLFGVEATAIMVTVAMVGPRLAMDRIKAAQDKKANAGEGEADAGQA